MNIEDLYTVDAHEAGSEMQVKDQFGKPLKMWIKIVGMDSKTYRNAEAEMQREIREGKDVEEAKVDAITKISIDWRGFMSQKKEIPFSKDVVKGLYLNAPYIMKQVDIYLAGRKNFTKG